ncbi:two-component system response regulator [Pseudoalteromonas agarivorans]|uniref:Two-component system response regulator n=1 Tax=Pseudoalteromonas agarivorans TaxID=176102 RepID=A0ABR5VWD0_9GAMM|nr:MULTISPECIES: response regulator [Pseudoalteromonas]KYL35088.1 two-component system response regulator [Pseudoalteromonas telluritireducens]MCK8107163.1 response regulator [Pseudoalteromonas sp. 2CM41L]MCW1719576.1 response regulator [Pseudoalteromonas sp. A3]MDC9512756.1 response regulator [Pseudoalteromonas sp. CST1]MDC9536855.1 response regulator [Pseudoalteromonas sp. CST3]
MALTKILAVDDEPFNLEIIEEILEDLDFELQVATSGPECLAMVEGYMPQVILLDVSMPQMNGYEVCKALKANPNTAHIIVMFVSARGTVEERMEGYSVGAEDYIVKPFGHDELKSKLKNLNQVLIEKQSLEKQVEDATSTAFNAMANSSEMGQIVNYIENIGFINNPQDLGKALIDCLQTFDLQSNVEFRHGDTIEHFALSGVCSPIVIELFDMLKNKGRLHEFSHRILVNYEMISLLILNMPDHDPDKHGRIRDHVCFIVSVTEQQLRAIMTKQMLESQQQKLNDVASTVHSKFHGLIGLLNENRESNEKVFKQLQEDLEVRIPTMGLDEDQEVFIYKKVDETIQNSIAREESVKQVKAAFAEIEQDLSLLLKK